MLQDIYENTKNMPSQIASNRLAQKASARSAPKKPHTSPYSAITKGPRLSRVVRLVNVFQVLRSAAG